MNIATLHAMNNLPWPKAVPCLVRSSTSYTSIRQRHHHPNGRVVGEQGWCRTCSAPPSPPAPPRPQPRPHRLLLLHRTTPRPAPPSAMHNNHRTLSIHLIHPRHELHQDHTKAVGQPVANCCDSSSPILIFISILIIAVQPSQEQEGKRDLYAQVVPNLPLTAVHSYDPNRPSQQVDPRAATLCPP